MSLVNLSLFNAGSSFAGTLNVASLGQATSYNLPDPGSASADICLSTGNCTGSGFSVTSLNSLQGALTIAGTANQVTVTDNGTRHYYAEPPTRHCRHQCSNLCNSQHGTRCYELYAMNQNVQTTDDVTFNSFTLTSALSVSSGGTGAATFTSNGVLYGNGAGAINATVAGTSGQLLLANATGIPTFTSLSGDIAISDTGLTTIQANSVALGTDTTGNYIATIAGNAQLTVTGSGSETAAVSLSITADSIGDSQLAFDTGQNLTTTSDVSFNSATLANGLSVTAGGVTVTAGNINATAGSIQTGGTTRVDNSGNLTNIGNITATGTLSNTGNLTATGTVTFSGGQLNLGSATAQTVPSHCLMLPMPLALTSKLQPKPLAMPPSPSQTQLESTPKYV